MYEKEPRHGRCVHQRVNLTELKVNAKFDFITFETPGKVDLPALQGRVLWGRKDHYRRFTLHDPCPEDIRALALTLGSLRILELEVAVDFRPGAHVPLERRVELLNAVMVDVFARGLDPRQGQLINDDFRAFYRRTGSGYKVGPFNKRLPLPTDQLLHGGRGDPAQVKCYYKVTDQGEEIAEHSHVARVEVRLSGIGLDVHGLRELRDLSNFKIRSGLMPYFRHVAAVERRPALRPTAMSTLLRETERRLDHSHWDKVGVGAFLPKGTRASTRARLRRDVYVNNRIGQALGRLEERYRKALFVQVEDREASGDR
jgi:hypothetical protein